MLQKILEDLSVAGTKLKSDEVLLPKFYDLRHVNLGHAMDKVKVGISSTQTGRVKAVLTRVPRETSEMVRNISE